MRNISSALKAKFQSQFQTMANNADPEAVVWITRPTVPLTDPAFLDQTTVVGIGGMTACDIAVRRMRADREPDEVFLAVVANGYAQVYHSHIQPRMSDYVWTNDDYAFLEAADDVAIAFDGTMPAASDGTAQFVTEERPWVFWVKDGVLKGRKLGFLGDVTLAAANAEKVTAIRASWSPTPSLDFGLIVFFTLSGALYYRQLIDGEWTDAEPTQIGYVTSWEDIAAFRTWDYRVGLMGINADNGFVYYALTQFEGLAKHGGEFIDVSTRATGNLEAVRRHMTSTRERIEANVEAAAGPYGGLYRTGVPQIVSAENAAVGENWGQRAVIRFDRHLVAAEVAAQPSAFRIVDSLGGVYIASAAQLQADGMTVRLDFPNFNGATGVCSAQYVPGSVHTMAGVALTQTAFSFTPQNLVPPGVPSPSVVSVSNSGDTQISIVFDEELTEPLTGAAEHFSVSFPSYLYTPGGPAITVTLTPYAVSASDSDTIVLTFREGNTTALNNAAGDITVEYDGAGPLLGEGGPVYPFTETFTPTGLDPKFNIGNTELLRPNVIASGAMTRIYYSSGYQSEIIRPKILASGTLTHINDL